MRDFRKDIEAILHDGVQAPSGDNLQPWRFIVRKNTIQIYAVLPTDADAFLGREPSSPFVSVGALIENIVISATHFGYEATVTLFPVPEDLLHVAHIELRVRRGKQEDPLYPYIHTRVTNRKPYKTHSLTTRERESLEHVPEELGIDARISIVENRSHIQRLAQLVTTQIVLLFSHKELHDEFYSSLRWDSHNVYAKEDGLDVRTLEINPFKLFFFKYVVRSWLATYALKIFGVQYFVAYIESFAYAESGAYCGIIFKSETAHDHVNAGRILERMWLIATRERLSIQPAFATVLLERILRTHSKSFSRSQTALIHKSVRRMKEIFGLVPSESLLFSVRIGKSQGGKVVRSLRRDPDIIFEE